MISRADRSAFAQWWRTIDRFMIGAIVILIIAGVIMSLAASPPVAGRIGLDSFHFVRRHIHYLILACIVLIALSVANERWVRRLALALAVLSAGLMILTLAVGDDVKGARRWLSIAGFSLQASEFMKPAFVVLCAWALAQTRQRPDMPGYLIAFALFAIVTGLLLMQPDLGQTLLVTMVWGALLFLTGVSWLWIGALGIVVVAGLTIAYFAFPHVGRRFDRFFDPASGDTFQIDRAKDSFLNGGWFGRGPGEGIVKWRLPDSHTDFTFAVVGEEFGIIACLLVLALFAFIVLRGLWQGLRHRSLFAHLAVSGLCVMFGLQAIINIAVNLELLPAKGMTLPFVSYGGSSLLSTAIGMGFVLALTRRHPDLSRLRRAYAHRARALTV